ncbi:hypothetical protein Q4485_11515 [Granulosicoccaceae sp. 1_MG-2023]|nr:hypothetical protein [Granulosicoccaceae sp. 1_MG-2023]
MAECPQRCTAASAAGAFVVSRAAPVMRRSGQRGAVLLLLCLALIVSSGVVLRQTLAEHRHSVRYTAPGMRLLAARDELIAYAVSYADHYGLSGAGPGHLPCPNTQLPDGSRSSESPDPPCGGEPLALGRLPRQSGSDAAQRVTVFQRGTYDANNAIWYAVSAAFVNNPAAQVNPATEATLTLDAREQVVAVLIDPGAPFAGRAGRPSLQPAAYLEAENADGDTVFANLSGDEGNDRVLPLSRAQLMPLVRRRVAAYILDWLSQWSQSQCGAEGLCFPPAGDEDGYCRADLSEGRLPLLADDCEAAGLLEQELNEAGIAYERHWFVRNGWPAWVDYAVDPLCVSGAAACEVLVDDTLSGGPLQIRVLPARPMAENL